MQYIKVVKKTCLTCPQERKKHKKKRKFNSVGPVRFQEKPARKPVSPQPQTCPVLNHDDKCCIISEERYRKNRFNSPKNGTGPPPLDRTGGKGFPGPNSPRFGPGIQIKKYRLDLNPRGRPPPSKRASRWFRKGGYPPERKPPPLNMGKYLIVCGYIFLRFTPAFLVPGAAGAISERMISNEHKTFWQEVRLDRVH